MIFEISKESRTISIFLEISYDEAVKGQDETPRMADMFSALGNEARLRILRLLLSAHPEGLIVGDIQTELGISASTLSHHLEKLRIEQLVVVERQGTFLWYRANTDVLADLLGFLYSECCTRNKAVRPESFVRLCK